MKPAKGQLILVSAGREREHPAIGHLSSLGRAHHRHVAVFIEGHGARNIPDRRTTAGSSEIGRPQEPRVDHQRAGRVASGNHESEAFVIDPCVGKFELLELAVSGLLPTPSDRLMQGAERGFEPQALRGIDVERVDPVAPHDDPRKIGPRRDEEIVLGHISLAANDEIDAGIEPNEPNGRVRAQVALPSSRIVAQKKAEPSGPRIERPELYRRRCTFEGKSNDGALCSLGIEELQQDPVGNEADAHAGEATHETGFLRPVLAVIEQRERRARRKPGHRESFFFPGRLTEGKVCTRKRGKDCKSSNLHRWLPFSSELRF